MSATTLILPPMAAVVRAENCGNCRYRFKDTQGDNECRRHAPQVSVLLVNAPAPRVGMLPAPFSSFPLIRLEQFCGEWEALIAA